MSLAVFVAAMLAANALSQGPIIHAPGSRPPKGTPQPRQSPAGIGPLGMLLTTPAIQKELRFTAAQKASINKVIKEMQARPLSENSRAAVEKYDKRMSAVLTKTQTDRLNQIVLQRMGGSALLDPKIQKQLGIDSAQKTKLLAVQRASRKENEAMLNSGKPISQSDFQKLRRTQDAKYMSVLSPAQKAKWKTMIGNHFAWPGQ